MEASPTPETDPRRIRRCLERNAKAVSLRPSVGQGTAVTKIRLVEGLGCEVEEGAWKLTVGVSDDVSPGYGEVRYVVTVESEAPEAVVRRVLDTADRYSSYRDIWARPIPLARETRISCGGSATGTPARPPPAGPSSSDGAA